MRRIVGSSMEPTFHAGQIVVASSLLSWHEGDVVVVTHDGLEKIKRLEKIEGARVFVVGDNRGASTDSRNFGWLPAETVTAKVVWPRYSSRQS